MRTGRGREGRKGKRRGEEGKGQGLVGSVLYNLKGMDAPACRFVFSSLNDVVLQKKGA